MSKLIDGVFRQNPVFRLALGLAPAIAITTTAMNGLVLGLTTAIILVVAALISAMLTDAVPKTARPVVHLGVVAVLTLGAHRILLGIDPQIVADLGIFLPLIVVNGFVLHSLERTNAPVEAVLDVVGKGLGFVGALVLVGAIREFLAYGSIFGAALLDTRLPLFALAASVPGGMVILGLLLALYNVVTGQGGELND
ncbi:MAG: hypothetical protein GX205_02455 [Firmicutes bacterium]|jgi:electron transport complex protein RnfE|nr:hypothetical protein [Bacillota bacterium]